MSVFSFRVRSYTCVLRRSGLPEIGISFAVSLLAGIFFGVCLDDVRELTWDMVLTCLASFVSAWMRTAILAGGLWSSAAAFWLC